jgi:hypothetical protein
MATKAAAYFLIIITLLACGSSSKTTSSIKKQDQKDIDSLLLVRSLPVKISAKDSLFRMDIQILLNDSLKTRKFECLNYQDATALSKKFMEDLFGVNNKQRMLDNIEKVKKDKEYLLKEIEFAQPIMQSVEISSCNTESANCIVAKRLNYPNVRKQKSWEFKYEQSESINHLVSRIIDSLTSH